VVRIHSGVPPHLFLAHLMCGFRPPPLPQESLRRCAHFCAHPEPGERTAGWRRNRCAPRNMRRCTGDVGSQSRKAGVPKGVEGDPLNARQVTRLAVPLHQGRLLHVPALGGRRKDHSNAATDFRMSSGPPPGLATEWNRSADLPANDISRLQVLQLAGFPKNRARRTRD
jgi:hypothetical protein